jgi:hypothetical protein
MNRLGTLKYIDFFQPEREMPAQQDEFFAAFREDHAALGRGFHELSTCLQAHDLDRARDLAATLEREAGAHIAFEENTLYPALSPLLDDKAEHLYHDHEVGLTVVRELMDCPAGASLPTARLNDLLQRSRHMEDHISECGQLFGAIGGLSPERRAALYHDLLHWRELAPTWTAAARHRRDATP